MHMFLLECVVLRCGVALVGGILYWPLLTPSWDPFSGTGSVQGDVAHLRP